MPTDQFAGGVPDKVSIGKDKNGLLEVLKPANSVIGDYESDFGSWTKVTTNSTPTRTTTYSYNGSTAIRINYSTSDSTNGLCGLERTMDLTNVQFLRLAYRLDDTSSGSEYLEVQIGGNTELQDSNTTSGWVTAEIDVSSYSGSTKIRIGHQEDSLGASYSVDMSFDFVRLEYSLNTFTDSGAGGTA